MIPPTRSRRAALRSALLATLAVAGLTACATPIGGAPSREAANPKAIAACRQRADAVYDQQNRGAVYRADTYAGSVRDAPFAGSGPAANPSSGLSGRYAHDTILDDCLSGASGSADVGTEAIPPATPAPALTALPPPAPKP